MDIQKFQQKLTEVCELGEKNGKVLKPEQIKECFGELDLDKSQLIKILQYLKLKGISIEGAEEISAASQTGGVQNKDLQREGHSRSHEHDEDDSAGHTHSGVKLLGNAQERADAIELHQHVVVDKDHAEEDSSEFDEHLISPPSSDCRCRSSSCARCAHPACLPARHSRPSGRRSRRTRREPGS